MPAPAPQSGLTIEKVQRQTIVVRWRVSGTALKRARPDLRLGKADAQLDVHVKVSRESGWALSSAWAELTSDGRSCRIEGTTDMGTCEVDAGMLHLDVPGLIAATIHLGAEPRLLYARTPLLKSLGLSPGTYEPIGCVTSSSC